MPSMTFPSALLSFTWLLPPPHIKMPPVTEVVLLPFPTAMLVETEKPVELKRAKPLLTFSVAVFVFSFKPVTVLTGLMDRFSRSVAKP